VSLGRRLTEYRLNFFRLGLLDKVSNITMMLALATGRHQFQNKRDISNTDPG